MSNCPRCQRPIIQNLTSCGACGAILSPFSTTKNVILGGVLVTAAIMLLGFFVMALRA